jgi:hypothetical protein
MRGYLPALADLPDTGGAALREVTQHEKQIHTLSACGMNPVPQT